MICALNFLKKAFENPYAAEKAAGCLERLANNSNNYEGILISRGAKHSRMRGCHFGKEKELIQFLLFKPHEKHTTLLFVISLHTVGFQRHFTVKSIANYLSTLVAVLAVLGRLPSLPVIQRASPLIPLCTAPFFLITDMLKLQEHMLLAACDA